MFAIITPALISGAFTNRVTFKAYCLFLPVVDAGVLPLRAHGLGRWHSARWGVEDFAGGIVVHNIAGMAALASILYVGSGA